MACGLPQGHVHNEGIVVGIFAGLIPCPLTLFTMFLAQSRGVHELRYALAVTMMIGVAPTLSAVAITIAFARNWLLGFMERQGNSTELLVRGCGRLAPAYWWCRPRVWLSRPASV